ncbi:MAG: hypothetical protein GDA36_06930 [Rhodobacteraceae bacterium]|nr:hypothetical protein [Paracoccaceae bacterium]
MSGNGHARFILTYSSEDSNPTYGQILVDVEDYNQIEPLIGRHSGMAERGISGCQFQSMEVRAGPQWGIKHRSPFFGPDPVILRDLSQQARNIRYNEGVGAIKNDRREQVQVIRPIPDTENARQLDLTRWMDLTRWI